MVFASYSLSIASWIVNYGREGGGGAFCCLGLYKKNYFLATEKVGLEVNTKN
jgi:hypothetical protein